MGSSDMSLKTNETFNERYTPPIKFGCHISKKNDSQKCLNKDQNKTHWLVHSKHLFLYCRQYMPKARPIQQFIVHFETKMDDKDDKLTKRQTNNGRTQIKLH